MFSHTSLTLICLSFLSALAISSAGILGTVQSVAVRGILQCNGKPSVGTKVKLYDHDTLPDIDDLMDEGVTDDEGHFELQGKETEITNIDPKLNVYHDCNDENIPCLKKFSIVIPDSFITPGEVPKKTFDAGTINLAGSFSGENRDCIN